MPQSNKMMDPKETLSNIHQLLEKFSFTFNNEGLLKEAFTHSSYVNEHRGDARADYQRLEFLGDAVLELMISQFLFKNYPDLSEGDMTKLRAAIVCETGLVQFADSLDFEDKIFLGRGEETTGGRNRPGLLCDVFEAFVGALYLDQGLGEVARFLEAVVYPKVVEGAFSQVMDYKSRLQEIVQQKNLGELTYQLVREGGNARQHDFVTNVLLNDTIIGTGQGHSKKDSEQSAASKALKSIDR